MIRPRRALAALGLAGALIVVVPPVALAAGTDRGLVVEITDPGTVTTSTPTLRGTVKAGQALLNLTAPTVKTITLRVVPAAGGAAVATTTQSPERPAPVSFTWSPNLARNGNYSFTAEATGSGTLGLANASGDNSQAFAVAAPARAPQQVSATVNADGGVTISWAPNTEADILGYRVFRSDPGSDQYFQIGVPIGIAHTTCSARCLLIDPTTAALGGEYRYQVLAFRAGPTEPIGSPASRPATASVPPPVPTTTIPADGSGAVPGPGGTPGTTAPPAVGSAKGPAISKFLANQPPAQPPPPPKILEAPDTGFNPELPFGALPEEDLEEEPGELEAVLPPDSLALGSDADQITQGRPLVPIAAGLFLLVLAGHLRLLSSRLRFPARGGVGPMSVAQSTIGASTAGRGGRDYDDLPSPRPATGRGPTDSGRNRARINQPRPTVTLLGPSGSQPKSTASDRPDPQGYSAAYPAAAYSTTTRSPRARRSSVVDSSRDDEPEVSPNPDASPFTRGGRKRPARAGRFNSGYSEADLEAEAKAVDEAFAADPDRNARTRSRRRSESGPSRAAKSDEAQRRPVPAGVAAGAGDPWFGSDPWAPDTSGRD
ncbi:MAG: hypothetical protein ACT4OS_03740 [Acidimicrobiales bacterium]